jgi:hypothetical protein
LLKNLWEHLLQFFCFWVSIHNQKVLTNWEMNYNFR